MAKIIIANFYPVWPIKGGGQRRIFFLARELSDENDVEILTPTYERTGSMTRFSRTFVEKRIPVDRPYASLGADLQRTVSMASDLAYAKYWRSCRVYQSVLNEAASCADALVTAHPYSIYALLEARRQRDIPIVFDSQNVELNQKKSVLGEHPEHLDAIRQVESVAIKDSSLVIACSSSDAEQFETIYGWPQDEVEIIENGVDALSVPLIDHEIRTRIRAELGVGDNLTAIFAGSFHHPNFQAADHVLRWAAARADMTFLFLGSICDYGPVKDTSLSNVVRLGHVDESVKWVAFQISDIGLNPMELGSGTNVKMFEYAAARLPVLTTPFGARGIPLLDGLECVIRPISECGDALAMLESAGATARRQMGELARAKILETSDWSVIGAKYRACFRRLLSRRQTRNAVQESCTS